MIEIARQGIIHQYLKHRDEHTSISKSVETFPAPLLCPFRFLVMFLLLYLHCLHLSRGLLRTQGPPVVADPELMRKHLYSRKFRAVLIPSTLDERSWVSTERVRFEEIAV